MPGIRACFTYVGGLNAIAFDLKHTAPTLCTFLRPAFATAGCTLIGHIYVPHKDVARDLDGSVYTWMKKTNDSRLLIKSV